MIFKENLIKLRKQMGLSQEELAEKIEVSRQTIYKWETGQNYPEMDRLLMLSELFNCSIDDLIKNEINVTSIVQKDKYEKFYNRFARNIAFAVSLVILSVAVMLILFDVFGEEKYLIPLISFFVFISISIMIFIISGIENTEMKKQIPNEINYYNEEKIHSFSRKFAIAVATGATLILIAVITLIVLFEFVSDVYLWPVSVMLGIISIATYILIYFGLLNSKYRMNHKVIKENPMASKISSIIMLLATIAYLIIGFVYNKWHPGWLVFPIGGILSGIVSVIFTNQTEM